MIWPLCAFQILGNAFLEWLLDFQCSFWELAQWLCNQRCAQGLVDVGIFLAAASCPSRISQGAEGAFNINPPRSQGATAQGPTFACFRSSLPLFSDPARSTKCNLLMVFLAWVACSHWCQWQYKKGLLELIICTESLAWWEQSSTCKFQIVPVQWRGWHILYIVSYIIDLGGKSKRSGNLIPSHSRALPRLCFCLPAFDCSNVGILTLKSNPPILGSNSRGSHLVRDPVLGMEKQVAMMISLHPFSV
jgi:hypothetical protein